MSTVNSSTIIPVLPELISDLFDRPNDSSTGAETQRRTIYAISQRFKQYHCPFSIAQT
jgi:hypothetical protein